MGELALVPGSAGKLSSPDAAERKATDYIGKAVGPPRQSFESFVIMRGEKVVFSFKARMAILILRHLVKENISFGVILFLVKLFWKWEMI